MAFQCCCGFAHLALQGSRLPCESGCYRRSKGVSSVMGFTSSADPSSHEAEAALSNLQA